MRSAWARMRGMCHGSRLDRQVDGVLHEQRLIIWGPALVRERVAVTQHLRQQ